MRTIATFIGLIFSFVAGITTTYAQYYQLIGDTIELNLDGYKGGNIQWQFSSDKQNWENIKGAINEKLTYIVSGTGYFRAKVNKCNLEYFTDTTFKISANNLDSIKICRWKDNASACLNFSFDDGSRSQKQISKIFDQFGFKATFFIIPSVLNKWYTLNTDSLKDICQRGHEIGNHTYSHSLEFLKETDISKIDFEIRKGKEIIEDLLKIKCASFADPWHQSSLISREIVFKYHLFSRDYSEYSSFDRLSIDSTLRINKVTTYLKSGILDHKMLIMSGHGIDNDGYSPITKNFLVQVLDSVKKFVDTDHLWVATLKEGEQYDNLFHEITLTKEVHNDTLLLKFNNYAKDKYKDLAQSPFSVDIPISLANKLTIQTDSVKITNLTNQLIYTTNLKRNTSIMFKIIK